MKEIIEEDRNLLTIKEASKWASNFLNRSVSESNIAYLIQYGLFPKYNNSGPTLIDLNELKAYYQSYQKNKIQTWKNKVGEDLNWALSFDHLREKDTTKHVHRLHPYKGKFIPQLVEYFIDTHINDFKKNIYFNPGDIILDPFAGSGTTLVQANELGLHSIGIDISRFNCMIAEVKLLDYDFVSLQEDISDIKYALLGYENRQNIGLFETELSEELFKFNKKYFPSPEFKVKVRLGEIDENSYSKEKEKKFLRIYYNLVKKYGIKLEQTNSDTFLDKWYCKNVRDEIDFVYNLVRQIENEKNKKAISVVLSRTIRSCRATTHYDLATLKEPQLTAYYCFKHKKICKPVFSIKYWLNRYANDTIKRLMEYKSLRKDSYFSLIPEDSRTVDIFSEVEKQNKDFCNILKNQKISGIFTSPPYVGQIDYHEQHAYAYDLFDLKRKDELEIGPLFKGQGKEARESYVKGISEVLLNCRKYMVQNFNIFLVANDKHGLYPEIVKKAGMYIFNKHKRPVLNRTERDKNPYSEIIFHIKNEKE